MRGLPPERRSLVLHGAHGGSLPSATNAFSFAELRESAFSGPAMKASSIRSGKIFNKKFRRKIKRKRLSKLRSQSSPTSQVGAPIFFSLSKMADHEMGGGNPPQPHSPGVDSKLSEELIPETVLTQSSDGVAGIGNNSGESAQRLGRSLIDQPAEPAKTPKV